MYGLILMSTAHIVAGAAVARRRRGRAGSRGEYHPVVIRHHVIRAAWRSCPG
jgi:hypothetical protein